MKYIIENHVLATLTFEVEAEDEDQALDQLPSMRKAPITVRGQEAVIQVVKDFELIVRPACQSK